MHIDIRKQTENVERAQGKCDNNMVSLRGAREECRCCVEKIREWVFVVQQGEKDLYTAFCAKKS
ncbi:hypothetical protein A3H22_02615 [Candidatus Peribacteria bacterium RIFCSPLOWO2_12_FULL_55_15]|nr:MAG: hypothetical protein A2789_04000 [Candidatus Peribacteria bacterium RIFCSPHIGHO2_01_FULL_54_22]OGJ63241.1 MAG: hypothetical protein A3D12_02825 [Candidatus Peribacteria bacterium RIFCSPHIGHO2_02_FULL_55_24]OGJ70041.1 MAG: hypothetical protein A3H90_03780 [Candidatus Peribacteria bacterium RIFCSPLOWO2_02_FULL_55_36]OGJ70552.1 MAG: hypothetical protein A3H22_02615 [Candidatus Peribacteria bacterium RIFCSPLOWO2_12_FULL_55_15]